MTVVVAVVVEVAVVMVLETAVVVDVAVTVREDIGPVGAGYCPLPSLSSLSLCWEPANNPTNI